MTQGLFSLEGRPAPVTGAARRIGSIVNRASLLSFHGGVLVRAYTTRRHALARFTKGQVNEWAPAGVRTKAVTAGYLETENTGAIRAERGSGRSIRKRISAAGWGIRPDLVGAVVFLVRPAAHNLRGHVLALDGGGVGR